MENKLYFQRPIKEKNSPYFYAFFLLFVFFDLVLVYEAYGRKTTVLIFAAMVCIGAIVYFGKSAFLRASRNKMTSTDDVHLE